MELPVPSAGRVRTGRPDQCAGGAATGGARPDAEPGTVVWSGAVSATP